MKKCKLRSCKTILSMYNPNEYCFVHVAKETEREDREEEAAILERKKYGPRCHCGKTKTYYLAPSDTFYTCKDCEI